MILKFLKKLINKLLTTFYFSKYILIWGLVEMHDNTFVVGHIGDSAMTGNVNGFECVGW